MTTTTLALIALALALALPLTRIGRQGGGCAVMHLICCHQGRCCWHHLCLHSWDDGTKDNSHSDRQGQHTNNCSREEVGHHDPISVEQKEIKN
jgi:hypothetical protein